ncbi:unnamed protein product [Ectocarpus sp. CCAP 1310/34]|nr:unnamed protein product [Ectocarpus sp. CCAP 1310/34]
MTSPPFVVCSLSRRAWIHPQRIATTARMAVTPQRLSKVFEFMRPPMFVLILGFSEDLDDDNMVGEDSDDEVEQDLEILSPVAAMLNEHSGQGDQGRHYLCCIINVVDEELYRVFVKEREKSNTVALTYPTEIHKISTARGKVLYYIAGWLLSKAWSRKRRHNIPDQEWDFIVQHNHSPSSAGAIERDPILQDMVGEVDARNDPVNGAGLLFPTLAWYEFVFHVENGIYHFLRDPYFLGTYLGDLSAEILRVVTESSEVRRAWAKCCPSAVAPPPFEAQPEILDDIYKFVLQKFHNVRMGDFARRLSQNSTLRLSKGELALRQNLRATSAKGEATAKGVAPVGGGIDGTSRLAGGVMAGSGTVTNEGLAVETVRKMTKPQLRQVATKPRMVRRKSNQDSRVMKCFFHPRSPPPVGGGNSCSMSFQSSKYLRISMSLSRMGSSAEVTYPFILLIFARRSNFVRP